MTSPPGRRVRVVGPGRAGGSVAGALAAVGWQVERAVGRDAAPGELAGAARDVDLVVVATPDASIGAVAAGIDAVGAEGAVVLHLSGSLGLDVLLDAGHARVAALHPLVSMPSPEVGAARLQEGAWFAVAGDPIAADIARSWGGTSFEVADADRALYHAAACIASNHLVALLGQVDRIASVAGVPLEAYLPLAAASLENAFALGPAAALTGPAARGDWVTIERHRAALDAAVPAERAAYDALVALARRLVPEPPPDR